MFHSHLSHAAPELKRLLLCSGSHAPRTGSGNAAAGKDRWQHSLPSAVPCFLLLQDCLSSPPTRTSSTDCGAWRSSSQPAEHFTITRSRLHHRCRSQRIELLCGSRRGLLQLLGDGTTDGALKKSDPLAYERLRSDDPSIGRAIPLKAFLNEQFLSADSQKPQQNPTPLVPILNQQIDPVEAAIVASARSVASA